MCCIPISHRIGFPHAANRRPCHHQEHPMPKHPNITLTPVTSRKLHGIGYDAASKTLAVRFHPTSKNAAEGKPGAPSDVVSRPMVRRSFSLSQRKASA